MKWWSGSLQEGEAEEMGMGEGKQGETGKIKGYLKGSIGT